MARLKKDTKNVRKAGRDREKLEREQTLQSLGFVCEPARVLVSLFKFPVYRDFFARAVPTGEFNKRGKPKVRYEGGHDIIGIHKETGGVALAQATLTPFFKMTKSEDGFHNTITWNLHLSHGDPAFPLLAEKGPLIPDTVEARDAKDPDRTFHVDEWLRSAELQARYPIVQYLVSYGHVGPPVRVWWRPGRTSFVDGSPPSWMAVPAGFKNAVRRKEKESEAVKQARMDRMKKIHEQKALAKMQAAAGNIKTGPTTQATLDGGHVG